MKEKIYAQYLEAYKRGAYNYFKEEYDAHSQEVVTKKYFSGGIKWNTGEHLALARDKAQLSSRGQKGFDRIFDIIANLRDINVRLLPRANGRLLVAAVGFFLAHGSFIPQAQAVPGERKGKIFAPDDEDQDTRATKANDVEEVNKWKRRVNKLKEDFQESFRDPDNQLKIIERIISEAQDLRESVGFPNALGGDLDEFLRSEVAKAKEGLKGGKGVRLVGADGRNLGPETDINNKYDEFSNRYDGILADAENMITNFNTISTSSISKVSAAATKLQRDFRAFMEQLSSDRHPEKLDAMAGKIGALAIATEYHQILSRYNKAVVSYQRGNKAVKAKAMQEFRAIKKELDVLLPKAEGDVNSQLIIDLRNQVEGRISPKGARLSTPSGKVKIAQAGASQNPSDLGGIDFDTKKWNLKVKGEKIKLNPPSPAIIKSPNFDLSRIDGFTAIVTTISPLRDLNSF